MLGTKELKFFNFYELYLFCFVFKEDIFLFLYNVLIYLFLFIEVVYDIILC